MRYAAVHAFALVEPEDGRAIGAATWGNAILSRRAAGGWLRARAAGRCRRRRWSNQPAVRCPLAGITFADAPYGTREPRCAVGGVWPAPDLAWAIVDAHLTYAGTEQRRAQVEAMAAAADGMGSPVIVAGDFNAPIEATEMQAVGRRVRRRIRDRRRPRRRSAARILRLGPDRPPPDARPAGDVVRRPSSRRRRVRPPAGRRHVRGRARRVTRSGSRVSVRGGPGACRPGRPVRPRAPGPPRPRGPARG